MNYPIHEYTVMTTMIPAASDLLAIFVTHTTVEDYLSTFKPVIFLCQMKHKWYETIEVVGYVISDDGQMVPAPQVKNFSGYITKEQRDLEYVSAHKVELKKLTILDEVDAEESICPEELEDSDEAYWLEEYWSDEEDTKSALQTTSPYLTEKQNALLQDIISNDPLYGMPDK